MSMSAPLQNAHPAGAKFPANIRISPMYGLDMRLCRSSLFQLWVLLHGQSHGCASLGGALRSISGSRDGDGKCPCIRKGLNSTGSAAASRQTQQSHEQAKRQPESQPLPPI